MPVELQPRPGVFRRFPATAINCFTGSLVHLLELNGCLIAEAELLERGDGFLLRSGLDEWGLPELTFAVQDVGIRGCVAIGAEIEAMSLDGSDWLDRLACAISMHKGAVVWVNTSRLNHDEFYSANPAYLHAVLVTGISSDRCFVRLHDPLIVNRDRYGCETWMCSTHFYAAVTDRVRTEAYDHMGQAHIITRLKGGTVGIDEIRMACIQGQADRYLESPIHHQAVAQYSRACMDAFKSKDDKASIAARRLFDHISVLYVGPCLRLLGLSLDQLKASEEIRELHAALSAHWHTQALLALKLHVTGSSSVLTRVEQRFAAIEASERKFWRALTDTKKTQPPFPASRET